MNAVTKPDKGSVIVLIPSPIVLMLDEFTLIISLFIRGGLYSFEIPCDKLILNFFLKALPSLLTLNSSTFPLFDFHDNGPPAKRTAWFSGVLGLTSIEPDFPPSQLH